MLRVLFSGFPVSKKNSISNSSSTRIEGPHETQLRLMWLPLNFIILFFYFDILTLDRIFLADRVS